MKVEGVRRARMASIAVGTTAVLLAAFAGADEAADQKAEAQRLFVEGQTALDKGDNARGCELMRTSLSLFAVANSLFNVAQCDEREGKIASALEHWRRGMSLIDATDPRAPVVSKAIQGLEARVPRVRILVDAKYEPIDIFVDETIVPKDNRAAVFVEPGKHVLITRKEGHEDRRVEIVLNEGERTEVVAEVGDAVAAPVASAVPSTSASAAPMPPLKLGGFVALGVGGAALLGAVISGGVISSQHGTIATECPNKLCSKEGRSLIHSQQTLLPLNAAFWGIGIAGAAAGTVMLVMSSRRSKDDKTPIAAPLLLPQGGGIGLSGRF